MTLRSPEAYGEVFEAPIGRRELSKEERATVREVAPKIVRYYLENYSSYSQGDWKTVANSLAEESLTHNKGIEQNYSPNEARLLSSLNRCFGELGTKCISAQLALGDPHGELSKNQAHQLRIDSADWQSDAIKSLFSLSELKLDPNGQARILDGFFTATKMAYRGSMGSTQNADNYRGMMLSGIYGPVALAKKLDSKGYNIWLPQSDDDVAAKTDLIFGQQIENALPNHLFLAQIKSTRGSEDDIVVSPEPEQLSTDEFDGWEVLKKFTNNLNSSPHLRDAAVDFSPVWARIFHAGLRDADDWRSGLDYIEASNIALPEAVSDVRKE